MAMQENPWGSLIWDEIKSLGITAGTPITDEQCRQIWTKLAKASKEHLQGNVDIDLQAGDIPVPGAGLKDSLNAPVTGSAQSGAKLLSTRIK